MKITKFKKAFEIVDYSAPAASAEYNIVTLASLQLLRNP